MYLTYYLAMVLDPGDSRAAMIKPLARAALYSRLVNGGLNRENRKVTPLGKSLLEGLWIIK